MRTPFSRRQSRPAASLVGAIIFAGAIAVAAAACTGASPAAGSAAAGSAAASAPSSAASTTGPRADACDVTALDGWPKPGHVATTGMIPVIASSQRTVGPSRLVWTLINSQNQPIAAPDLGVEIGFFDLCKSASQPVETQVAEFAWGITNVRGFYITQPTFTHSGTWGAAVIVTDKSGKQTGAKIIFDVSDTGTTPAVGSKLPSVRSLTLDDVGGDVRKLSSDTNPNPDFYRLSVDQALAAHTPFVLAMATPAFCQSAECGPTLDHVKQIVAAHPITVINVEPYVLRYQEGANGAPGRLQPVLEDNNFVLVEATKVLSVPTEPWIFVIDGNGTVVGSFEAVVGDREMADAIAKALATK